MLKYIDKGGLELTNLQDVEIDVEIDFEGNIAKKRESALTLLKGTKYEGKCDLKNFTKSSYDILVKALEEKKKQYSYELFELSIEEYDNADLINDIEIVIRNKETGRKTAIEDTVSNYLNKKGAYADFKKDFSVKGDFVAYWEEAENFGIPNRANYSELTEKVKEYIILKNIEQNALINVEIVTDDVWYTN